MWISESYNNPAKDLRVPSWDLSAIWIFFLSHRYHRDKAIIIIIIIEQLNQKILETWKSIMENKDLDIYKFKKLETLLLFWEKHSFISITNHTDFNRLNKKEIMFL